MSTVPAAVELEIAPRQRDLGGFSVRRVLPTARRRAVGPFVFLDHLGPASLAAGAGLDVPPHPHIGLATVTYLFEGELVHRDSLGIVQSIRPGDVNLMTAGRGIAHSERSVRSDSERSRLHGLQFWLALPAADEDMAPAFAHYAGDALPGGEVGGVTLRVLIGEGWGLRSPVATRSPTLCAEARVPPGVTFVVPAAGPERALYIVAGQVRIDGYMHSAGTMLVLAPGAPVNVTAAAAAHLVLVGGAALGERRMWWNFVATSEARIEQAKADWRAGRFAPVPGETEVTPLPER